MNPTASYYELLEISPHADLAEISTAYLRISRELAAEGSGLPESEIDFRQKLLKHAYDVLSNPSRRSDYDAGLARTGDSTGRNPLHVEVALEPTKWSPIRRLLTLIAGLMVLGMVMQISVMFMAYQRSKALGGEDVVSPVADKAYLQDFYQTYGIRAASRAEAELLLADMQRKDKAERDVANQRRLQEEEERKLRRFEEESRRLGAEVTANNLRAEQEAERARLEEARRKEEQERQQKADELARRQQEINRFRFRPGQSTE